MDNTNMDISTNSFCEGGLWNTSLFLDQLWPEFTPCFISVVPTWVPCCYVWLLLPHFIFHLRKIKSDFYGRSKGITNKDDSSIPHSQLRDQENGHHHRTIIVKVKVLLLVLLTVITTIDIFRLLISSAPVRDVLSGFVLLATLILLCFMSWCEGRRRCHQSFIFFYFFSLLLILGTTKLYTWTFILDFKDEIFQFTIITIFYGLNFTCLVFTCIPEIVARAHPDNDERADCPEMTSPYPARLFFTWMKSLMIAGFRHDLTYKDVWKMNPRDTSYELCPPFEHLWTEEVAFVKKRNKERNFKKIERAQRTKDSMNASFHNGMVGETTPLFHKKKIFNSIKEDSFKTDVKKAVPNLFKVLTKLLWKKTFIGILKRCGGDVFTFLGPVILGALIDILQHPEERYIWQAYALSLLLLITGMMRSALFAQSVYSGSLIGLEIKTVLTNAIFKKALTISGSSKKNTTVGEIVNLMSVDCQRIQEIMPSFFFSTTTPLQIMMAVFLLYNTLGVSVFVGVLLMILTAPLNTILADKQKIFQTEILDMKDKRIKLVNEILNGMKVLKMYAWEMEFKKKVEAIRKVEIDKLFKVANIYIVLNTVAGLLPFLVGLVTFATYVLMDSNNVLDAKKTFVSLALFNLLRPAITFGAILIVYSVQTFVCLKRINTFLNSDDLESSNVSHSQTNQYAVEIKSGEFSWNTDEIAVLKNIDFKVAGGSLVAVVGPVGSGKSSLLSAILGELHKSKGHVNTKGKIGYVSQQAWIQNATVKANILFGEKCNKSLYTSVIEACQLMRDFEILEHSDQTEIGEKGINISGGQKQRVSLARAAYSQSDIFLFDDPLSAVDSHVGKAIFHELIGPNGLLSKKTRILVTHGIQWLPEVDTIFVLRDGQIVERGSYKELMERNGEFSDLINEHKTQSYNSDGPFREQDSPQKNDTQAEAEYCEMSRLSEPIMFDDSLGLSLSLTSSLKSIYPETPQLTTTETLETGKVSSAVYLNFIKAAGVIVLPSAFLIYTLYNVLLVASSFWLSKWTEEEIFFNKSILLSEEARSSSNYYLSIYAAFGVGQSFSMLFWYSMVKAGQHLHSLLLKCLFKAPLSFFDQTPIGRILNRFSRDVDIVDNNLPLIIKDFTLTLFWVLSTIIVVLIQTPIFAVALVPLIIIYLIAQNLYVRTSRQLKRMESIARSPVYTHFSETITGASVIRAYGASERFIMELKNRLDENQLYYFASQAAIRWLQLNLDLIASLVVFFAALFQILDGGGGSDAGLSVSYALQITGIMTYMVRQICEFETNIVCVERMKEYSNIEQEADFVIPHNKPNEKWPEFGCISFCDYALSYRPGLPLVLKGISCEIKQGEKVGIVGRTGAGKSSLTLGLLRIVEAAGGCITIDGIKIADIGLHDLRKRLTVLPQDPVLFSGTLRMNIDPFDEHTDESIWKALEHSHLKRFVAELSDGLLYECGEEGSNLSIGQRQLVCLTRALLRKSMILILDEATAAVDLATDALIQKTIRGSFKDYTVLSIAHRIHTIMDYDKVIVIDAGNIKEFDSPQNLLDKKGIFFSMCKDAEVL